MKKKQMCVDFQSKLSGVTNMRQEFTVCQIKATFQLCVDFHYFPIEKTFPNPGEAINFQKKYFSEAT